MYEEFVREQFGLEVDFPAIAERLGAEAAGVLFSMVVDYYGEWRRTKTYIGGLAQSAADAEAFMTKRNKPYDLHALPAVSLEQATRALVASHRSLEQALNLCGLLNTPA